MQHMEKIINKTDGPATGVAEIQDIVGIDGSSKHVMPAYSVTVSFRPQSSKDTPQITSPICEAASGSSNVPNSHNVVPEIPNNLFGNIAVEIDNDSDMDEEPELLPLGVAAFVDIPQSPTHQQDANAGEAINFR